jgi:Arc/MetJ-type ribon-helix-helix transcriptional regulator
MSSTSDEYVTVRLPKELMDEVDEMIRKGVRGYKSRAEFIKEAIRKRTEELAAKTTAEMPVLEHFNVSEQGVRILDRSLQSKSSKGRIIDVYFKPDNAWCDYCESSNCNHVRFALNLAEVQETLNKKGWKIK